jgi:hypothetical protein
MKIRNTAREAGVIVGLIVIAAVLIILGPLALIWALNTLFPVLAIEYTFWTWLAAFILTATVSPSVRIKKS